MPPLSNCGKTCRVTHDSLDANHLRGGYLLVVLPRSISSQKVYGVTGETSRLHSSTHSLSHFDPENKLTAAKLLGIGKGTLYRKLKGYGSTQEVSPNG